MDKSSKLERWLAIVANLAVVGGIVFLAAEINQNTRAIERQGRIDYVDGITEPFLDDVPIGEVLAKVKAVDGRESFVQVLMDQYNLTEVEAATWNRHLYRVWYSLDADFNYAGRGLVEPTIRALLPFRDSEIYWDHVRSLHSAPFTALVDEIRNDIEAGA